MVFAQLGEKAGVGVVLRDNFDCKERWPSWSGIRIGFIVEEAEVEQADYVGVDAHAQLSADVAALVLLESELEEVCQLRLDVAVETIRHGPFYNDAVNKFGFAFGVWQPEILFGANLSDSRHGFRIADGGESSEASS